MTILDDIDNALSGGSKSAFSAETPAGTSVTGVITDVDYRQVTDFTTQQPATFPSGDKKMQFIIRIQPNSARTGMMKACARFTSPPGASGKLHSPRRSAPAVRQRARRC